MPEFDEGTFSLEYDSLDDKKQGILKSLKQIVMDSYTPLEGNIFYLHNTFDLAPLLYTKQLNLFWCGKQAKTRICEIGFNAGHSAMVLLLGRDTTPLEFTIFDLGEHLYTNSCVKHIQSIFPHVRMEYVKGDSIETVPKWISEHKSSIWTYDVVHVDGGHNEPCISNDMKQADLLVRIGGIIIIDDTDNPIINNYANIYLNSGFYREMDVLKTYGYTHRIIQKIK
jgi:hypothetical protein